MKQLSITLKWSHRLVCAMNKTNRKQINERTNERTDERTNKRTK